MSATGGGDAPTRRIHCWSGPRNLSTALMYSFRQRPDTRVCDEPLYGPYLARTHADHPGRDELLELLPTDPDAVVREVLEGPCDRPVFFAKQMAHHLTPDVDRGFLRRADHVLLVREPADVIRSYVRQVPDPRLRDLGLAQQVRLRRELRERGRDPAVLDARTLLADPPGVLRRLCDHLQLDWTDAMLSWPPGPKPEDGPWARWWYDRVHRSTGFAPYRPSDGGVPERFRDLLAACRPLYEELAAEALR